MYSTCATLSFFSSFSLLGSTERNSKSTDHLKSRSMFSLDCSHARQLVQCFDGGSHGSRHRLRRLFYLFVRQRPFLIRHSSIDAKALGLPCVASRLFTDQLSQSSHPVPCGVVWRSDWHCCSRTRSPVVFYFLFRFILSLFILRFIRSFLFLYQHATSCCFDAIFSFLARHVSTTFSSAPAMDLFSVALVRAQRSPCDRK